MLRNMTNLYILNHNKILMLYRIGSRVIKTPKWVGIGGHFEEEELNNPDACVLRELFEETGITAIELKNIELKYITMRYLNNEVRQNYYYFAELANSEIKDVKSTEGILEWVTIDEVFHRDMPLSASSCLKHYFDEGKIVSVFVLNQECEEEYENGNWEHRESDFAVIHRLCVNPIFQNKKIGKKTMNIIEEMLRQKGIESVRLDAFSLNPYALKLYENLGYIKVGKVVWRKGQFYLFEKKL